MTTLDVTGNARSASGRWTAQAPAITASTAGPACMLVSADHPDYCPMAPAGRLPSSRAPMPRASPPCEDSAPYLATMAQTARASLLGSGGAPPGHAPATATGPSTRRTAVPHSQPRAWKRTSDGAAGCAASCEPSQWCSLPCGRPARLAAAGAPPDVAQQGVPTMLPRSRENATCCMLGACQSATGFSESALHSGRWRRRRR